MFDLCIHGALWYDRERAQQSRRPETSLLPLFNRALSFFIFNDLFESSVWSEKTGQGLLLALDIGDTECLRQSRAAT